VPVHDLPVPGVAVVTPALLDGGAGFVERSKSAVVVLGAEGGEPLHHLAGGGGELEVVAVGEEGVDPGLCPDMYTL
jgi:hypothetical protein